MSKFNLQYLRRLSLVVSDATGNGYDFGNFRCVFHTRRGDMQTPNTLDVRIYNVKPATANTISQKEFTTLTLKVGYGDGALGLIFTGNIVQFRQGRTNQLDSYVDLTAADGDEAYNYATIAQTVPAGTKPGSVASYIITKLTRYPGNQPITQGYQPEFPGNGCVRGQVLYGMAKDAMREFALQNNCKWSIQDGAVTLIPWTSFVQQGGEVPVISVSTGLIGTPEQTQAGISIKTLMNPNYKVGQLIKLDSQINLFRFGIDLKSPAPDALIAQQNTAGTNIGPNTGNPSDQQGLYYVMTANHSGDTRGTEWYTDMVCLSVDATLSDANQSAALLTTAPPPIQRYGGT